MQDSYYYFITLSYKDPPDLMLPDFFLWTTEQLDQGIQRKILAQV